MLYGNPDRRYKTSSHKLFANSVYIINQLGDLTSSGLETELFSMK